ncbi:hypothetical protein [Pseudomonas synxantha]|uniref:hypothetical protein n=1 Tax=Pseudomonas synxantha TaxID=47883 RepID=UPI000F55ADDE|nr:hypothetical protein [Pseudomonas synxantha]
MSHIHDMTRLLRGVAQRQWRHEANMARIRERIARLSRQVDEMDERACSLKALLASHDPSSKRLDRGELFEVQRRQAVIRRQIHVLAIERSRLLADKQNVEQELASAREAYLMCVQKQQKYQHRLMQLKRARKLAALRGDELEQEELTHGRSKYPPVSQHQSGPTVR